jgi:hypothetical protein
VRQQGHACARRPHAAHQVTKYAIAKAVVEEGQEASEVGATPEAVDVAPATPAVQAPRGAPVDAGLARARRTMPRIHVIVREGLSHVIDL